MSKSSLYLQKFREVYGELKKNEINISNNMTNNISNVPHDNLNKKLMKDKNLIDLNSKINLLNDENKKLIKNIKDLQYENNGLKLQIKEMKKLCDQLKSLKDQKINELNNKIEKLNKRKEELKKVIKQQELIIKEYKIEKQTNENNIDISINKLNIQLKVLEDENKSLKNQISQKPLENVENGDFIYLKEKYKNTEMKMHEIDEKYQELLKEKINQNNEIIKLNKQIKEYRVRNKKIIEIINKD